MEENYYEEKKNIDILCGLDAGVQSLVYILIPRCHYNLQTGPLVQPKTKRLTFMSQK